jgi:hypothetical protein
LSDQGITSVCGPAKCAIDTNPSIGVDCAIGMLGDASTIPQGGGRGGWCAWGASVTGLSWRSRPGVGWRRRTGGSRVSGWPGQTGGAGRGRAGARSARAAGARYRGFGLVSRAARVGDHYHSASEHGIIGRRIDTVVAARLGVVARAAAQDRAGAARRGLLVDADKKGDAQWRR